VREIVREGWILCEKGGREYERRVDIVRVKSSRECEREGWDTGYERRRECVIEEV
jgi:hypothetical protein